jgi:hypothetical protein
MYTGLPCWAKASIPVFITLPVTVRPFVTPLEMVFVVYV